MQVLDFQVAFCLLAFHRIPWTQRATGLFGS